MLSGRNIPVFPYIFLPAGLIPATTYLEVQGLISSRLTFAILAGLLILVFLRSLLVLGAKDLEGLLTRVSASILALIYPAVFLSFIVRLTVYENASRVLLLFFCMSFANDILAYLAGMFLGRRTRLGLAISPNKSAIGFAAGVFASVGMALLFKAVFPDLLAISYGVVAVFGAVAGTLTILGDLVESALKRSAAVKDSGSLIPGRGGILDSIDSWLLNAPLFYFVFLWISR